MSWWGVVWFFRVQDEVLSTPQGVVRLMDMVQEREVREPKP